MTDLKRGLLETLRILLMLGLVVMSFYLFQHEKKSQAEWVWAAMLFMGIMAADYRFKFSIVVGLISASLSLLTAIGIFADPGQPYWTQGLAQVVLVVLFTARYVQRPSGEYSSKSYSRDRL